MYFKPLHFDIPCIVLSICQIFRPATVDMGHKDRVPGSTCCVNTNLRNSYVGLPVVEDSYLQRFVGLIDMR